jgi:hypothetical protein
MAKEASETRRGSLATTRYDRCFDTCEVLDGAVRRMLIPTYHNTGRSRIAFSTRSTRVLIVSAVS